jgi:hypothetical protein
MVTKAPEEKTVFSSHVLHPLAAGAQLESYFAMVGSIKILEIMAVVEGIIDITTMESVFFQLTSAGGDAPITSVAGVAPDLSGQGLNSVVYKNGAVAVAMIISNSGGGLPATNDCALDRYGVPCIATFDEAAATTLDLGYTSDIATHVIVKVTVRYIPLSETGALVAV